MTAGRVFLTKVRAYRPTFSTVLVQVAAAPAGAAHCHLGIYRSDGAQTAEMRAATVDALATVATTGIATITLTNPVTVAPGDDVYVAVLVTGSPTTPLQLRACAGSPAINGNLVAGQGLRCGASGAGLTALPPAVDLSAMTTVAAMAWTAVR